MEDEEKDEIEGRGGEKKDDSKSIEGERGE